MIPEPILQLDGSIKPGAFACLSQFFIVDGIRPIVAEAKT
jgi:hypothetical protein